MGISDDDLFLPGPRRKREGGTYQVEPLRFR